MDTGAGPGGRTRHDAPASSASVVPPTTARRFLDAVPDRPLSLVVAPAGTGKTTVAAAWARTRTDLDLRWVTAGRTGHDELAAHLEPDRVVVVDDADRLGSRGAETLRRRLLVDPDRTRLLLLARHAPTWVPASTALAGQVGILRFPGLRLDDEDAGRLVRLQRPEATADQVREVVARSAGWAAALVVGAQDLPAGAGPLAPVPAVLDELLTDMLGELPGPLLRVLTCVASEGAVTTDLAVLLSGVATAGRLLADAADGLLVTHRDDLLTGGSWELHPLLRSLLDRRSTTDPDDRRLVQGAHARAARHHARQGHGEAALRHAARSGDLRLLVEMLHELAPALLSDGRTELVEDLVGRLPEPVRSGAPELVALDALLLRGTRRYDAAKRAADRALSDAWPHLVPTPDLEADLAVLDVWEARCGWRPRQPALDRAARVLGCSHTATRDASYPLHGHDTSGMAALRGAWLMVDLADLELWAGHHDSAAVHLEVADAYAAEAGVTRISAAVLALRALAEMIRGAYQTSAATAAECLALQARDGLARGTFTARAHLVRGWARFHGLDHEGAATDLATASEGPDPLDPVSTVYRRLLEVNLLLARGDLIGASRALDREDALPRPLPGHAQRHLGFARFCVAGYGGDLAGMVVEARAFRRAGHDADADLTEAMVRGLSGSEVAAVRDLDALLARTDVVGTGTDELTRVTAAAAAVSRVALLHRIGAPEALDRAVALLPETLGRVAPQGLWWLLATGSMIAPRFVDLVAAEAARPDAHPAAADALAMVLRQPRPSASRAVAPAEPPDPRGGLTARELEVLRALGRGGSNHEIARSLFVTENTVKTHLSAIYRKLGVSDRTAAATVARRRGLLGEQRANPEEARPSPHPFLTRPG